MLQLPALPREVDLLDKSGWLAHFGYRLVRSFYH